MADQLGEHSPGDGVEVKPLQGALASHWNGVDGNRCSVGVGDVGLARPLSAPHQHRCEDH